MGPAAHDESGIKGSGITGSGVDWAAVAERSARDVYRAALPIAGDEQTAWDCAQEAFLTALRGGAGTTPDDPARWLCGVARNHARNLARSRRRRVALLRRLPSFSRRSRPLPEPDRAALLDALARLPAKEREAVGLRYLAGLSIPELARALDVDPEAAKSRVRRGLARLRRRLGATACLLLLVREARSGTSGVPRVGAASPLKPLAAVLGLVVVVAVMLTAAVGADHPAPPPGPAAGDDAPAGVAAAGATADEAADAAADVARPAAAPVRGRVVNAWGRPVSGATVELEGEDLRVRLTDDAGRFEFDVSGERVRAGKSGEGVTARPVPPEGGDLGDLAIAGSHGLRVRGIRPDGSVARRLRVTVMASGWAADFPAALAGDPLSKRWAVADEDADTVVLGGLAEGPVGVLALDPAGPAIGLAWVYPALASDCDVPLVPAGTALLPPVPEYGDGLWLAAGTRDAFSNLPGTAFAETGRWRVRARAGDRVRCLLPAGPWTAATDPGLYTWISEFAVAGGGTTEAPPLALRTSESPNPYTPAGSGSGITTIYFRILDGETAEPLHRIATREMLIEMLPREWQERRSDTGVIAVPEYLGTPCYVSGGGTPAMWITAEDHEVIVITEADELAAKSTAENPLEIVLRRGVRVKGRLVGARAGDRVRLYLAERSSGARNSMNVAILKPPRTVVPAAEDGTLDLPPLPRGRWFAILETADGFRAGLGYADIDEGEEPTWEAPPRVPVTIRLERSPDGLPAVPILRTGFPEIRDDWLGGRYIPDRFDRDGTTQYLVPARGLRIAENGWAAWGVSDFAAANLCAEPGPGGRPDVTLKPGRRVRVRVHAPEGYDLPLQVSLVPASQKALGQRWIGLDAEGRGIVDVPAGPPDAVLFVGACDPGGRWNRVLADVRIPTDAAEVETTLDLGLLRLRSAGGRAVLFLTCPARAGTRESFANTVVPADGEVRLWLAPGTWEAKEQSWSRMDPVVVRAGETAEVVVTPEKDASSPSK